MPAVVLPGRPVPKGRARVGKGGAVYTPAKTREYEERVAWLVKAARAPVAGACEVSIVLALRPGSRGDIDNYAKALLDGLVKGGGIADDRDVTRLLVRIVEAEPGLESAAMTWDRALEEAA